MTPLARVLDACAGLGIRNPAEFFALPSEVQSLWVAHYGHIFTGAYTRKSKGGTSPNDAATAQREFTAAKRGKK